MKLVGYKTALRAKACLLYSGQKINFIEPLLNSKFNKFPHRALRLHGKEPFKGLNIMTNQYLPLV